MSNTAQVRIDKKLLGRIQSLWARILGRPVRIREAVEKSIEYTLEKERSDEEA